MNTATKAPVLHAASIGGSGAVYLDLSACGGPGSVVGDDSLVTCPDCLTEIALWIEWKAAR